MYALRECGVHETVWKVLAMPVLLLCEKCAFNLQGKGRKEWAQYDGY